MHAKHDSTRMALTTGKEKDVPGILPRMDLSSTTVFWLGTFLNPPKSISALLETCPYLQNAPCIFVGLSYSALMACTSCQGVIFWLFVSLLSFYSVFYITASLVHGIFKLNNFDGTIPFHYSSYQDIFTNSTMWETQPFISDFITLECTYFVSTFVFLTFLRQRLWDFAITVTIIHCAVTCAVNVKFPLVWEWWICVFMGLGITIAFGQLINVILNLKKIGPFTPEKNRTGAVS